MPSPTNPATALRGTFWQFYRGAYADDHRTWPNRALHLLGTLSGITLLIAAATTAISPWWALAFPIVHAAPGLIGHRLFERNAALGDVRVIGGAYPGLWFMAANHLRLVEPAWNLLRGRW
jgi:hypothetical protein